MSQQFVHLHVHSHYSFLDGGAKVPDLIKAAVDYNMPALALTDHGNMFGSFEFYLNARKAGIKPIVGYEAYIAPKSRLDRDNKRYHITLLAKNYQGYKNLLKLASEAYLTGFYYKPRIDKDLLVKHKEGIIALSGCLASEVCQNLLAKNSKSAKKTVDFYRSLFGDDYYIELQKNKIEEQSIANAGLLEIAQEFHLPMVFTNDIHYLKNDDHRAHDVLLCIQTGAKFTDKKRFRFGSQEFYMKSPDQMYAEAAEFPGAAENTLAIAEKVNLEIPLGDYHLPPFTPPDNLSNEEYLRKLCEAGLKERYGEITPEVRDRFEHEFKVICGMGFSTYFLIVWDFINYARQNGIPVGPGRGSAAGSIVAYSLRITNLDPIKYGLIFERFLNEGRNEMPDIDIDFETERRGEVIEYVRRKYGEKQVAQIVTFGTMAARAVIRDVGRALDVPLPEVDQVAKKIPAIPKMTLEKALKTDKDFAATYHDPKYKDLIDIGMRLEGLNRQSGIHAAGVIISDQDISEYCPLQKTPDGTITTQYSMEHIDALGLLKMDFLGLNTLTLIEKVLEVIKSSCNVEVDLPNIPLDDQETFDMLSKGETNGVFQLESEGMQQLIKKLSPDRFGDIIALVALYRPGPLKSGMVDTYCRCKHKQEDPVYKHPILEKLLEETHGIILYQEQAMQIAKELAGFTLSEADKLRKAMGKKKQDLMDAYRKQFIEGAKKSHNVPEELSGEIFGLIEYFSGYGFNKSHSAAYALVTYQTAYLKAHYPLEFMAALMTIESQNTDKLIRYIQECDAKNIEILPPQINKSKSFFSVEQGKLRYGLAAIKGVGEKAIDAIVEERNKIGKFESIFHLCEHVDTRLSNKQVLEALVKSGAMDCFERPRSQMFHVIPEALQMGGNLQKDRNSNQMTLFGDFVESETEEADAEHLYPEEIAEWADDEKAKKEKETLGFYLTDNPLKKWGKYLKMLTTHQSSTLNTGMAGQVMLGGMISGIRERAIKSGRNQGRKMANFTLEDLSGLCPVVCFPNTYDTCKEHIEADEIVFIKGKLNAKKEEPEIILDEMIPASQGIERLAKKILIHVENQPEETITKLREICGKHRGFCRTLIEVENQEHRTLIEVAEKFYVQPSYTLIEKLENLLGEETIVVGQ